ncbi:MAG TPA: hypothetical protein VGA56_04465 [Opitutaceae bacterium]
MKLSAEQKQTVAQWLKKGASIAEVQRRLREEFEVSLTYMDTRFLIDDLGLNLAPPPKPKAEPANAAPAPDGGAKPDEVIDPEFVDEGDAFAEDGEESADPASDVSETVGSVKVEVDRLMRPGSVVSGNVTFSDGNSGTWALDQYGRLVFEAKIKGYRPSKDDLQAFQRELSSQLQRQGY